MASNQIIIKNESGNSIRASISTWGSGGSPDYFSIENNQSDSWGRSDPRGYVVAIVRRGKASSQLAFPGDVITVTEQSASGRSAEVETDSHAVLAASK